MKKISIVGLVLVMAVFSCNKKKSEPITNSEPIAIFKDKISDSTFSKLQKRLKQVNNDVLERGIVYDSIRSEKLLTGYSYGEYYDWDLYYENI